MTLAVPQAAQTNNVRREARFLEDHAYLGMIDMGPTDQRGRKPQAHHWRFIGWDRGRLNGADIRAANAHNGVGRPTAIQPLAMERAA